MKEGQGCLKKLLRRIEWEGIQSKMMVDSRTHSAKPDNYYKQSEKGVRSPWTHKKKNKTKEVKRANLFCVSVSRGA